MFVFKFSCHVKITFMSRTRRKQRELQNSLSRNICQRQVAYAVFMSGRDIGPNNSQKQTKMRIPHNIQGEQTNSGDSLIFQTGKFCQKLR